MKAPRSPYTPAGESGRLKGAPHNDEPTQWARSLPDKGTLGACQCGGESQRRKRLSLGLSVRRSSCGGGAGTTDPVATPALHSSSHFVLSRVWARG